MLDPDLPIIHEEFFADRVLPETMDELWAEGWRHFGTHFFRYSLGVHDLELRRVIPLRILLGRFGFSKSQRRNLRRNAEFNIRIRPLSITPEAERLFHLHKMRFSAGVPDSIFDFVPREADRSPSETMQLSVFDGDTLVAESYFDLGAAAASGIYAMFDPAYASRGLGTFTLLKEIEFLQAKKKEIYYLGYAYEGSSFYDYKKRFAFTESFDWVNGWLPFTSNDST